MTKQLIYSGPHALSLIFKLVEIWPGCRFIREIDDIYLLTPRHRFVIQTMQTFCDTFYDTQK